MFKFFNASFFVLNLVNCICARIQQIWILFLFCGLCAGLAEAVFSLNDEGKAIAGEVTPDDEEAVNGAIASCPVEAIVEE